MLFVPFAAVFLLLAAPAQAVVLCSQPTHPWCAGVEETFADKRATMKCLREVEDYVAEVKGYSGCLAEKAEAVTLNAERLHERAKCHLPGKHSMWNNQHSLQTPP